MTNKRFYLDYNATSPLCSRVSLSLANNEYPYANSSSQHRSGKRVNKQISECFDYLYKFFGLSSDDFRIIFHSGATEGINTIFNLNADDKLFYFPTDHPCVQAISSKYDSLSLQVDNDGHCAPETVSKLINTNKSTGLNWLNFTAVNNETGVVWDLEDAVNIKDRTGCLVHVDAVQMPAKIYPLKLSSELDAYTFSAHKFGALKGVGFSFVKKSLNLEPFIYGGGQQSNFRSGTLNTFGIFSVRDALEQLQEESENFSKLYSLKNELVDIIRSNSNLRVVENKSSNTICFMHKTLKSDILLVHFDMAGLDVSSGSACSSGSVEPSRVLSAMGYKELANHNIRISIGFANLVFRDEIISRFTRVIRKL